MLPLAAVPDLGPPIAYIALQEGMPVYDRRGSRIGVVDRVLADEQHDIFEGVVVHTLPLPGRHLFADVEVITELGERGVRLSVDGRALPEPADQTRATDESQAPDAVVESRVQSYLRRAWDWLSRR